ncbi:MAG TPA: family 16 glycoside hydrolase [Candidatus Nitrosocosmicus sp.]|nr:family 16 glycoside hydrolase [Candidatus Nitrosocosmicus sp.]
MATSLILALMLELNTYNTAYSSISSSTYDNIQNKFDNLLSSTLPDLNPEWRVDPQNEEGTESQPAQTAAIAATSCQSSIRDNFDRTYLLGEGRTSPNGEWKNVYSGYGSTGVKNVDSRSVFYLNPKAVTSAAQTYAALVKSTDNFCNFTMQVHMNTVKQLRQNSPPNTWEVGWLFFRYTDTFHYYWVAVKPNGIELGKKDCNTCTNPVDGQKFLVTKSIPKLNMNTWNKVTVDMVGNHVKVYWNGNLVIDYIDRAMSSKLASGNIAMYTEDAYVLYNGMAVSSK